MKRYEYTQLDLAKAAQDHEAVVAASYEAYKKQYKEEQLTSGMISEYDYRNKVAPRFDADIAEVLGNTKDLTTFGANGKATVASKYQDSSERMIETYDKLVTNVNFFEKIISPKTQSGMELMQKSIQFTTNFTKVRGVASTTELMNAGQSIQDVMNGKGGYFAAFDMETLSGKNKFGHDDLLGVTEYAFNIHGANGELAGSITNTVGLQEAQYKQVAERLAAMEGTDKNTWSELDRVMVDRLNFYSNMDIAGGARRTLSSRAGVDYDNIRSTIEGAQAGLEKLGRISDEQLKVVQSDFTQITAGMQKGGKVNLGGKSFAINAVTGHNVSGFDVPKQNRANVMYGVKSFINEANSNVFDLYQSMQHVEAMLGLNHYGSQGTGTGPIPRGMGQQKLEYLKAKYPGVAERVAAEGISTSHAAYADTLTSAYMLQERMKNGNTILQETLQQLERINKGSKSSLFTGGHQQLYRIDQASSYDGFSNTGAIGFVHDKFGGTVKTFDGYEINNGKASKGGMSTQPGLKRGALYNFDLQSFKTGEDFRAAFGSGSDKIMSQFNTEGLYVLKGIPVYDKNAPHAKGAMQDIYYVSNSLDSIKAMFNNMQHIGNYSKKTKDGSYYDIDNFKAVAGISKDKDLLLEELTDGTRKSAAKSWTDDSLLKAHGRLSTDRLTNEYGANYVRDLNLDKYKKFKSVIDNITKTYSKDLKPGASIADKIAFAISKGETLGGFNNPGGVFDPLVFNDNKLMTNSVNRMAWASENMESLMPILDEVSRIVEELIPGTDNASKFRKNEAFKIATKDIFETVNNEGLITTAEKLGGMSNSKSTQMVRSALNYIELTGGQAGGLKGDEPIKLKFGNTQPDENLVSKLYRRATGGKYSPVKDMNGQAGKSLLLNFMDSMEADSSYKGVFKGINTNQSTKDLNAELMHTLDTFVSQKRKTDSVFGIMNKDNYTQVSTSASKRALQIQKNGMQHIEGITKNVVKNMQNYVMFDRKKDIDQNAVDALMKKMIHVSAADIKALNLDEFSKTTLRANYELARADMEKIARDMLGSLSGSNLQLSFDERPGSGSQVFVSNQGKDAKAITLAQMKMKNGTIYMDLGTTSHVMRSAVDTRKLDKGQIEFQSQLGAVMNKNKVSFGGYVGNATRKGSDEIGAFTSAVNNMNQGIRKGMPAIQFFNPQAFEMQMEAHVSDITGYLDKFAPSLENMEGFSDLTDNEKVSMQKLWNKIEKNSDSRELLAWEGLDSSPRSIFINKLLSPLLQSRASSGTSFSNDIQRNLMPGAGKSTHIADSGTVSIGRNIPDVMTAYDAQGRDNPTQYGNMYQHDKKEIERLVASDSSWAGKISASPLITDSRKDAVLLNTKTEMGTEMTGMVTGKFAAMDTGKVKRIIISASGEVQGDDNPFIRQAKIIMGKTELWSKISFKEQLEIKRIANQIKEKALHTSTYMQETIIDSRFAQGVFNKSQRQIIDSRKLLEANSAAEKARILSLQFDVSKGKLSYGKGFQVEADEKILVQQGYANSRKPFAAKEAGLVRGAFFDSYNNIVSAEDINKKLNGKLAHGDVEGYMKSKFGLDFKYFVDPFEAKDGVKISVSRTEKSVAYGMQSALGSLNPNIVDKLKGTKFERYAGKYVTDTLLDFMENSGDSRLKGIKELAMTERHSVSDVLFRDIFEKTGIIAITNQDVLKHAGISVAITSAVGRLKSKGLLTQKNVSAVFPGALLVNGSVKMPDASNFEASAINLSALGKLVGDEKASETFGAFKESFEVWNGEFAQTVDWQGGTSQGVSLRSEIENLKAQRASASPADRRLLDQAIEDKQKLLSSLADEEAAAKHIHRGFVYSDRMHDLLGAKVLNDDYIKNIKVLDDEDSLMKNALGGFVDENGNLKADFKGQQLMSPVTDLYKNGIFSSGQKLSNVSDNDIRFGHIKKFFGDSLGADVSAAWAEKTYSVTSTKRALEYNYGTRGKSKKQNPDGYGSEYGFTKRKFADFEPQAGASIEALDKDGAYFNNTMFDMGEEFGDRRYLAMARPAYATNGDSLTLPDHMVQLNTLKSQFADYQKSGLVEDKNKVSRTMDSIVEQQSKDFGLMQRKLTQTRLDRSFTAKGAGMAIIQGEGYEGLSADQKYKQLKKINGINALTNAEFEGKSYLKHYSEGRYLNAVLMSEKAFEDMGYFTQESLARNNVDRAGMVTKLQTKGDIHLVGRFPMIRESSATTAWAILDQSLTGNEMRVLGSTQMAMNLDFDGDTVHAHALTNKNGKTYLENNGASDAFHDRVRLDMASRSIAENRFYEDEVQRQLNTEIDISKEGNQFDKLARKAISDGDRVYANLSAADLGNKKISEAYTAMVSLKSSLNLTDDNKLLDHIKENMGENEKLQYAMYKAKSSLALETAAKTQKSVIGESNVINFKARKIFSTFMDRNVGDYNMQREMFSDTVEIFEQEVISSKNAKDIDNLQRAEQWKRSITNIIAGNNVSESKRTISSLFDETISEKMKKRYDKYNYAYPTFRGQNITESNFTNDVKTSFLATLDNFQNNKQVQDIMATTMHLGEDKFGSNPRIFEEMALLATDTSIQGAAAKRLNAAGLLGDVADIQDVYQNKSLNRAGLYLADGREYLAEEATAGQSTKKILSSAASAFEKMTNGFDGKTLAMGALGLAGAYLVAGFVGGNPSAPADNHAAVMGADNAQYYTAPSFRDQDMQNSQPKQQGYVVNMNARTGYDSKRTAGAINGAVSQSYNSNMNISMNITDDSGNINDRYVENLLAGAL